MTAAPPRQPNVRTRGVLGSAVFSPCMRYRYSLVRPLGVRGPRMLMVLLNPSTADEDRNDPTIRRCVGFAQREGVGELVICNAYGLRSTDPGALTRTDDPVGPSNIRTIVQHARRAERVAVAWGVHGGAHARALADRLGRRHRLECLGTTRDGWPKHPLYLSKATPFVPYPT